MGRKRGNSKRFHEEKASFSDSYDKADERAYDKVDFVFSDEYEEIIEDQADNNDKESYIDEIK